MYDEVGCDSLTVAQRCVCLVGRQVRARTSRHQMSVRPRQAMRDNLLFIEHVISSTRCVIINNHAQT